MYENPYIGMLLPSVQCQSRDLPTELSCNSYHHSYIVSLLFIAGALPSIALVKILFNYINTITLYPDRNFIYKSELIS